MIKNIIFDIGNVLVDFHPKVFFQDLLPRKYIDEICQIVFGETWDKLDEGSLSSEQVRYLYHEQYPALKQEIDIVMDHWMEMMTLKEDTYAFMKACKAKGLGIYLLSNIGAKSHAYLEKRYDFFALADGMVLSYQIHCNKPKEAIFNELLDTCWLKAEECIFIDDSEANIEQAKAMGFHGIVYTTMEQVENEVKALC